MPVIIEKVAREVGTAQAQSAVLPRFRLRPFANSRRLGFSVLYCGGTSPAVLRRPLKSTDSLAVGLRKEQLRELVLPDVVDPVDAAPEHALLAKFVNRVAADPCPCGGLVNRERARVADARLRDGRGDGEVLELPIAHGGSFRCPDLLTAQWRSLPKSRAGYSQTGRRCVSGTSEAPANGWARGTKREFSRRSRRAGPSRRAWGRRARLGPPEAYRLQLATEDGEEAGVAVVTGDLGHERVGEDHAVSDGGVVLFENAHARFPSGPAARLLWSRRP